MSEYTGRQWVCSCGWKGSHDNAYDHAEHDCHEDSPNVGPRYRRDRHTSGQQATLSEVSAS